MNYPECGTRIFHHEDECESWSIALRASMPALRGPVEHAINPWRNQPCQNPRTPSST